MREVEPLDRGTRIEKINSEPGDGHRDGSQGSIASALGPAADGTWGYFVRWDDMPEVLVFIAGRRVRPVN
jgi:hypothetical protein